jgi:hypothetical protein
VLAAALPVATAGCGGCGSCAGIPAGLRDGAAEGGVAAVDSGLAPSRCSVSRAAKLDEGVAVGEAAATAGGFVVGLARRAGGQQVGSLALVRDDADAPALVDLGPAYGDDPLPRPFAREGDVLVARYARAVDSGARRELRIARIEGGAVKGELGVAQALDESLSYDVSLGEKTALVAWDEDGPAGRGVVLVASFDPALPSGAPPVKGAIVSPDASDAESPRLAPRPGGYWLVWTARRAESIADAAPDAYELEGPAEARAFHWLEAAPLDAAGARVGDARKLTPTSGHVTQFELAPIGADLDVVFRDESEVGEGQGGRVLRVRVRADGVDAPAALVPRGVGRGAPDVLAAGGAAWLSFVDADDRSLVVPLGKSRDPAGLPSDEPSLRAGRLLAVSRREGGDLLAAAAVDERRLELRRLRCSR